MKKILSIVSCLILCTTIASAQVSINTLSKKEEKQGWQLLFNGKNLDGWTSVGKTTGPEKGWTIEDGILTVNKGGPQHGRDIITQKEFSEFDLYFEFRLTKAANSGLKYLFRKYEQGGWAMNTKSWTMTSILMPKPEEMGIVKQQHCTISYLPEKKR